MRAIRIALVVAIVLALTAHHYGGSQTLNEGVYWTVAGHSCGIEYRGTVGGFCDVN